MGGGKSTPLTWACLSAVSRPTANVHKREISVTQSADCLPRGHDLSVFLVPSSADVLDPVWNAHARNPGKQQPFHKRSSDLVVRWEPSVRRHHPSQSHPSYCHSACRSEILGRPLNGGVSFDKPRYASGNVVPQKAPAVLGCMPGQTGFFL